MMTRLIQESKYHSVAIDSREVILCHASLQCMPSGILLLITFYLYTQKADNTFLFYSKGRHVQTHRDFITSLRLHIQTCSLTVSVSDIAVISKLLHILLPLQGQTHSQVYSPTGLTRM